jgi:hypothetical protein
MCTGGRLETMTETDELMLRKLVESMGACSLHVQWARYYVQRTSDFIRENVASGMKDFPGEEKVMHAFSLTRSGTALTRWTERFRDLESSASDPG